MVGSSLVDVLVQAGHEITRLTRAPAHGEAVWDPEGAPPTCAPLVGHDAVVHIEGSCVPWYSRVSRAKSTAHRSATVGTSLLVSTLLAAEPLPQTFVLVTTAAFYGDHGGAPITEQAGGGPDAFATLAAAREAEVAPLERAGVRVVRLRVGTLLDRRVNPLRYQVPLFRAGLGGRLGSGEQFWSWITVADLVSVIQRALVDPTLTGPVNAVTPYAITSARFATELASHVGRRALLRFPAPAVRAAFGPDVAEALVLSSRRVVPLALQERDHCFRHPTLASAFEAVL